MKIYTREKTILVIVSFALSLVTVSMTGLLYTLFEKAFGSGTFWVVTFGTVANFVFTCLSYTVLWQHVKQGNVSPFHDSLYDRL